MNGDGICELYINNRQASGTGGYAEGIFQKSGDTYGLVVNLFGFDLRLAEKKNGHLQFVYHQVIYKKEGGKSESPILYQFNGKEYAQVKTPGWNSKQYNAKGVEKYNQKDYKSAQLYFINALRVRTLHNKGYDIKNNLALSYIKAINYELAEQLLNEILTSINNNSGYAGDAAAAYYNLGQIYEGENDRNKALFYYKESLSGYPSDIRRQKVNQMESKK